MDVLLGIQRNHQEDDGSKYVQGLQQWLSKSYEEAAKNADLAHAKQKRNFDRRSQGAILEVGDWVLVRQLAFQGKHNLANCWENRVYGVIAQNNPDIPVYVVQPEDQSHSSQCRILHRNHLLPIGKLLTKLPRSAAKVRPGRGTKVAPEVWSSATSESEAELDTYIVIVPPAPVEILVAQGSEEDVSLEATEDLDSPDPEPEPVPQLPLRRQRPPKWPDNYVIVTHVGFSARHAKAMVCSTPDKKLLLSKMLDLLINAWIFFFQGAEWTVDLGLLGKNGCILFCFGLVEPIMPMAVVLSFVCCLKDMLKCLLCCQGLKGVSHPMS